MFDIQSQSYNQGTLRILAVPGLALLVMTAMPVAGAQTEEETVEASKTTSAMVRTVSTRTYTRRIAADGTITEIDRQPAQIISASAGDVTPSGKEMAAAPSNAQPVQDDSAHFDGSVEPVVVPVTRTYTRRVVEEVPAVAFQAMETTPAEATLSTPPEAVEAVAEEVTPVVKPRAFVRTSSTPQGRVSAPPSFYGSFGRFNVSNGQRSTIRSFRPARSSSALAEL
tara:strand:- start:7360 stop:8034 length:675 start_codon:yes stop_codon:yes gene_type:complete